MIEYKIKRKYTDFYFFRFNTLEDLTKPKGKKPT